MKHIILLETVETRYVVDDEIGEKFLKDKEEHGCYDPDVLMKSIEGEYKEPRFQEEVHHGQHILNTYEDCDESHPLYNYVVSNS